VTVVSDSTYVVNCFRDSWYKGWMSRGWKNSQKQPVANQDLWKPLIQLYLQFPGKAKFEWVKGHSGNPMNDLVDELAVAAAATQRGRVISDPMGWFVGTGPEPAAADESAVPVKQASLFE
jgi:ribonuclease HI